jgi:hypothetical protein
MEKLNYNILSNSELEDILTSSKIAYDEAKEIIGVQYEVMQENAEKYDEVKKVLNKRNGK